MLFHCVNVCISHIFSIHSSDDGHLGCFCILAVMNSAVINMGMHTSCQNPVFMFLRGILRSGIAELNGRSTFNFLRNLQLVFHSGWSNYIQFWVPYLTYSAIIAVATLVCNLDRKNSWIQILYLPAKLSSGIW